LLRLQRGLSQKAVALAVGVDRAAVARWELGVREPRDRHLAAYLRVLDRLADQAS
jgi:HTH-type transcriptional regulator/antitoxin MqsA